MSGKDDAKLNAKDKKPIAVLGGDDKKPDNSKKEEPDVAAGAEKIILTPEELETKISEAVKAAISNTNETEKNKLYETLDHTKQELKKKDSELQRLQKIEEEKQKQEEDKRLAALSNDERTAEQIKQLNGKLGQMVEGFDLLKKQTDEKLRQKDLEVYREKLVLGAKGEIIPEMVVGNSIEELDKAFQRSKDRYGTILQEAKAKIVPDKTQDTPNNKKPVSTEIPQDNTPTKQFAEKSASDIMNMSPEEFATYKDSVLDAYNA
jgi:hypothetical protein